MQVIANSEPPKICNMDTKKFWEERLEKGINLTTTGHRAFSLEYNQWLYQAQVDCLDDLIQENKLQVAGASLLDIGCGGGFFIDYFVQKGVPEVTGIDITRQSIEYLRGVYPSFSFFESDIASSELPIKGPFKIITAISVMFHIVEDQKFQKAIENIAAFLEPGGVLILCDAFHRPWHPVPGHVQMRSLADYTDSLNSNNLEIVDLKTAYFFLNRVFVPWLGPKIINTFHLGHSLYRLDSHLRRMKKQSGAGIKFLLARKKS
jgi:SAM-dependent methyltransferase